MPRPLFERTGDDDRRRLLRQRHAAGLQGTRLRAPRQGGRGRPLDPQAARRPRRVRRRRDRLLPPATEDRVAQLRRHRPAANRALHRPRRLSGPGPRAGGEPSGRDDRDAQDLGAPRPRRRRLPHLAEMETHPRRRRRRQIRRLQRRRRRPRRLHGPQRPGRRSPQRHRGDGHRRAHDRGHHGLRLRAGGISPGGPTPEDRLGAMPPVRPAGQEHPRRRIGFRPGNPHGLGGLRLRRGNGPAHLDRGQPGRAPPPAPLPRPKRPLGQAHAIEQRRDVCQRAGHRAGRRPVVRLLRHPQEPRHQGLRPGRRHPERRIGRGAHRHGPGRPALRHRRRHPPRKAVQGGADRRPLRRLHPPAAPQRPPGLRIVGRVGRHHRLRRTDRHGRG